MKYLIVSLLMLCPFLSSNSKAQDVAQEAEQQKEVAIKKPDVEFLHTEIDAIGWVFDALGKYQEEDRPFIRFVYLPPWADPDWVGVVDYAMNAACSHSRTLYRGDRHAGGWLLGYNMQVLCPDPIKLEKILSVWDGLSVIEPRFHMPAVNSTELIETYDAIETDRFGRQVTVKRKRTKQIIKNTAFLAPHLEAALAKHVTKAEQSIRIDALVTQISKTPGPVYPADFLIEQLLTSAAGKYPEFRLMDFTVESGTPLQTMLKRSGFFFEQSTNLRGDKGAVILISDVTGKGRVVITVSGLTSQVPAMFTFDIADKRTAPGEQFIRNLVQYEPFHDATEVFIPMQNGLIEFVLADSKGNLQRVAPSNVVADSTKPNGHTKELEMGMSCIICHGPEDGYKTAKNDAEYILGSDVDYFGDGIEYDDRLTNKRVSLSRQESIDLVAGRFGERIDEPDGIIGRARRDYIRAVDSLTGWGIGSIDDPNAPSAARKVATKIEEIYHGYRYSRINADRICLELGVRVPQGQGKKYLKILAPAPKKGDVEDIVIGLVRNGAEIIRSEADSIYGELARRAVTTRATLKQQIEEASKAQAEEN